MSDKPTFDPASMPLDPMVYIARATRREDGRPGTLEIFYDDDPPFEVEDGDEFFTIQTAVLLEDSPKGGRDDDD